MRRPIRGDLRIGEKYSEMTSQWIEQECSEASPHRIGQKRKKAAPRNVHFFPFSAAALNAGLCNLVAKVGNGFELVGQLAVCRLVRLSRP